MTLLFEGQFEGTVKSLIQAVSFVTSSKVREHHRGKFTITSDLIVRFSRQQVVFYRSGSDSPCVLLCQFDLPTCFKQIAQTELMTNPSAPDLLIEFSNASFFEALSRITHPEKSLVSLKVLQSPSGYDFWIQTLTVPHFLAYREKIVASSVNVFSPYSSFLKMPLEQLKSQTTAQISLPYDVFREMFAYPAALDLSLILEQHPSRPYHLSLRRRSDSSSSDSDLSTFEICLCHGDITHSAPLDEQNGWQMSNFMPCNLTSAWPKSSELSFLVDSKVQMQFDPTHSNPHLPIIFSLPLLELQPNKILNITLFMVIPSSSF